MVDPTEVLAENRMRNLMRTRLSICMKKTSYRSAGEALLAASRSGLLRTYRCDRCNCFHLTSRTKGKRIPRPQA